MTPSPDYPPPAKPLPDWLKEIFKNPPKRELWPTPEPSKELEKEKEPA